MHACEQRQRPLFVLTLANSYHIAPILKDGSWCFSERKHSWTHGAQLDSLGRQTWRASGRRHEKRVAAIVRTHRFRYFSPFLDLWDQVKPMSLQQWLRSHLNPPSELPQRNSPRELAPLDHGCDPPVGGPPSPAPQRLLVFGVSEWAGVSPRKSNQSQSFNQTRSQN